MRVVIDANVAIAAAASRGLCESIAELCLERHQVVMCEGLLREIETKLKKKLKVAPAVVDEFLRVIRDHADILEPEAVPKTACRDPGDLMVLGLVGKGQIDVIISGDRDLLVLKTFKGAKIQTPREFWESNKTGK